jgi:hypothetical protein
MREIEKTNGCVREPFVRYALIPLWYTTEVEGPNGENEKAILNQFVGRDPEKLDLVKVGDVWGTIRSVTPNGKVTETKKFKYELKDKKNEIKVVVSRVNVTENTQVRNDK